MSLAVLFQAACNTGTTQTHPHQISNTQRTENKTTNVVIQQHSRKLLMMGILISETCWVHKKWNKIASEIKVVFYSSTSAWLIAYLLLGHGLNSQCVLCKREEEHFQGIFQFFNKTNKWFVHTTYFCQGFSSKCMLRWRIICWFWSRRTQRAWIVLGHQFVLNHHSCVICESASEFPTHEFTVHRK